ncbi:hypothetical protein J8273_3493 [Carpediemonas membranifera]|uniref:Uncharacterized protein n=1 Tax=Carpediemonas membranifera TaxID=201153 RepID=A0A8J6AT17_9EUKA|nr:hypothetical protein J8273_3493 [Carpediemonas membranifera]|eukprot:KAG9393358.1 hypothetical protein J8273_3493 [Carpediemonas membranifera]
MDDVVVPKGYELVLNGLQQSKSRVSKKDDEAPELESKTEKQRISFQAKQFTNLLDQQEKKKNKRAEKRKAAPTDAPKRAPSILPSSLSSMDWAAWGSIPDPGMDLSGRNKVIKQRREEQHQELSAVPDSVIEWAAASAVAEDVRVEERPTDKVEEADLLKLGRDDPTRWNGLARLYNRQGKKKKAQEIVREGLQPSSISPGLLSLAAEILPPAEATKALARVCTPDGDCYNRPDLKLDALVWSSWISIQPTDEDKLSWCRSLLDGGNDVQTPELWTTAVEVTARCGKPLDWVQKGLQAYGSDSGLWKAYTAAQAVLGQVGVDEAATAVMERCRLRGRALVESTKAVVGGLGDAAVSQYTEMIGDWKPMEIDEIVEIIKSLTPPVIRAWLAACPLTSIDRKKANKLAETLASVEPNGRVTAFAVRVLLLSDTAGLERLVEEAQFDEANMALLLSQPIAQDSVQFMFRCTSDPEKRSNIMDSIGGYGPKDQVALRLLDAVWGDRQGRIPVSSNSPESFAGIELTPGQVDRLIGLIPAAMEYPAVLADLMMAALACAPVPGLTRFEERLIEQAKHASLKKSRPAVLAALIAERCHGYEQMVVDRWTAIVKSNMDTISGLAVAQFIARAPDGPALAVLKEILTVTAKFDNVTSALLVDAILRLNLGSNSARKLAESMEDSALAAVVRERLSMSCKLSPFDKRLSIEEVFKDYLKEFKKKPGEQPAWIDADFVVTLIYHISRSRNHKRAKGFAALGLQLLRALQDTDPSRLLDCADLVSLDEKNPESPSVITKYHCTGQYFGVELARHLVSRDRRAVDVAAVVAATRVAIMGQ